ncbi:MAG: arginine--tRNA ligase, partial [Balneolaceae bacterium]|nr:arginine--tRNA ligase [Balneolaceae bacterium]
MKQYLQSIISKSLEQFDLANEDVPEIQIEKPNQPDHGDAACNVAMMLARPLKKNPRKIAEEIVEGLDYDPKRITSVEIAGPGFINFRYAESYLFDELETILEQSSSFGKTDEQKDKRVLVEFVSANPTGPLTVGHGRNAVLGDTVARLLEWTGAKVDREYYFNNAGRQMRVLGESVKARYLEALGKEAEFPEGGYKGEYIKDIAEELVK